MSELTVGQIFDVAKNVTLVTGLILVLAGGYFKWWVFGWAYDEVRQERDEWRRIALQGSVTLNTTVEDVAKPAVQFGREGGRLRQ